MLRIINVVGARPNFIKIAPILNEMALHEDQISSVLVNTGQHYDKEMVDFFFQDLDIPAPNINLGVGSGSHAAQTAKVMTAFEKVCDDLKPDLVLVVGDVNSTLACSLVATKLGIKVAHVESGLRSYDRSMPEEINREVTDLLSDFLFTTSEEAEENLLNMGIPKNKIFFVGNVMIDSLNGHLSQARSRPVLKKLNLEGEEFALLTLHRPSNVDNFMVLEGLFSVFEKIQKHIKIVFPAHPRTVKNIEKFKLSNKIKTMDNFKIISPQGYLDFLALINKSKFVLTDSGGLQEETTVLGIPCLTLRSNTERPVTISMGTNILVGLDLERIDLEAMKILDGHPKKGKIPPLWDGKASKRLVEILLKKL